MNKPIELPHVTITPVFRVDCSDPKCHTVSYVDDAEKAEEKRQIHLNAHRAHEESLRRLLADHVGDDEFEEGPIPALHCPSSLCNAAIGFAHDAACDVAACLSTGLQRADRNHVKDDPATHDCGVDVWNGFYPAEREALKYGVTVRVLKTVGRWDPAKLEWVLDEGWEDKMNALDLGPKISGM